MIREATGGQNLPILETPEEIPVYLKINSYGDREARVFGTLPKIECVLPSRLNENVVEYPPPALPDALRSRSLSIHLGVFGILAGQDGIVIKIHWRVRISASVLGQELG